MRPRDRNARAVALLLALIAAGPAPAAIAHVRTAAGPFRLQVGWADEPAYSGERNAVDVAVSDAAGAPVADLRGALTVAVRFGEARLELPLRPSGRPGRLSAALVPTRPGTYAFHVTGRIRGRSVDADLQCSQHTFDCVTGVAAIQFPVADPASGQLDAKLDRALARARRSTDRAGRAQTLALIAIAGAVLALVAALGCGARRRRAP